MTYQDKINRLTFNNIIQCIDTLNEFVQGPCEKNQLNLIDGQFFEIASKIMDVCSLSAI